MGRYWYLRTSNDECNIIRCEGKFWFGIQKSNDFENIGFKESEDKEMYWKSCGCIFEKEDMTSDHDQYCTSCFDSYEEHKQTIEIDCGEKVSGNLYEETEFVLYEAKKEDIYDKICEIMKPIENDIILSEFFDRFIITCEKKDYEIIVDHTTKLDKPILEKIETYNAEILARMSLCKIMKFMIDLGATEFYVECEF